MPALLIPSPLAGEGKDEGQPIFHPHLNPLPSETVSQCHPDEALPEGSRFYKRLESLDSSPAAQNDIHAIFVLRHSLSRERRLKRTGVNAG
jgi:hypothetical protein